MEAQTLAMLILLPFTLAFIYAGIHEYLRFRSKGRATYGLVYDDETGTTHVTGIADHQDAFDPDDFDPNDFRDPDINYDEEEETPRT